MDSTIETFNQVGLCLFTLPKGKKKYPPIGWRDRTPADNDLAELEGGNVGVALGDQSGGLVDIDLDHWFAVRLGQRLLPPTGWKFGRKGKPISHWIYRVENCGNRKAFESPILKGKDADGKEKNAMLCEYRATGTYTVFPPSIHPSNEQIEFAEFSQIAPASREELLRACGWVASGVELFQVYREGIRHELWLALCGGLLNSGKTGEEISTFIEGFCDACQDSDKRGRLQDLGTTIERKRAGNEYTGWTKLIELIGKEAVDAIQGHLTIPKGGDFGISQDVRRSSHLKETAKSTDGHSSGCSATAAPEEMNQNDDGTAEAFAEYAHNRAIYVPEVDSFYVYQEGIWAQDTRGTKVRNVFSSFVTDRMRFLTQTEPKGWEREGKYLLQYKNQPRAKHAIERARSFLEVPVHRLDQSDDVIPLQNGLFDLKGSRFLASDPSHYLTHRSDIAYDPAAKCPLFEAFLKESFKDDRALIRYLQAVLGYCLTGRTNRQEFYIFYGERGRNGKGTIIRILEYILGSYASPIQVETLFENPFSDKSQNELFTMIGKRLAIANEAQSTYRLKASFIKAISGEDRQKAKGLYKDAMAMTIKFKLIIQCNERPFIDASDKALCSRVKLIEFPNRISDAKRDINLTEKLKAEGFGILNWLIEGVQRYYQNQIEEPLSVKNATNAYLADNDTLARFLGDYTIGKPGSHVFCNEFYDAYKRFCQEEGDQQLMTQNKLGRFMTERGYMMDKRRGRRAYIGIEFVPEGDAVERAYGERFNSASLPLP